MPEEASYRQLYNALKYLYSRPSLIEKLKSNETFSETMRELHLQEDTRTDLLNLINLIEQNPLEKSSGSGSNQAKQDEKNKIFDPKDEISGAQIFFDDAVKQLKRAYSTSQIMSVIMFIMGVFFLLLAGYQAITNPENVAETSIVGGIGVAQIVIFFYRRPLADVARSVSNTQQAKIALVSYLIGLNYINNSIVSVATDKHLENLLKLTENTIGQMKSQK